jgi:hypothetical protein
MSQRTLARFGGAVLIVGLVLVAPARAIIINGGKSLHLAPYAAGQVVRVYASNLGGPDTRGGDCGFIINWFQPNGAFAQEGVRLSVQPGTVEAADFFDARVPVGAHRLVRIEAVLMPPSDPAFPPGPCVVQFDVFDRLTGRTQYLGGPDTLPSAQTASQ